ncbi:unnamed protein product [Lampetra planeri]
MDTPTYGQILTQQKSKETPPCGQDPKGFFGIKERTLSIGNQFDQECQLISRVRPVGRLRSSTSGSTQERAATSGSARLIFSSTERVDSGASCDQRVGSTLLLVWDSAEFSRLSGLDSSDSPSPLQAGKTRLTAQLGLRGPTSAESEVSAAAEGRGLATRRRPSTARCERAVGATYRPGSELRQRINRHPNQFNTATGERLIRMTRTAPSPHDHQASV